MRTPEQGLLGKVTTLVGGLALVTACAQEPPIHEGKVVAKDQKKHEVLIAQCPQGKLPTRHGITASLEVIKKECKTNSVAVPQDVFDRSKLEQHVDFTKLK